MALYQGTEGKITVKTPEGTEEYLVHMSSWTVDMAKTIDESSFFGGSAEEEGFVEKTPGVKSWTGSIEGAADLATGSGQTTVLESYAEDTLITATFYLNATTGIRGNAYVENITVNHTAEGKAEISASLSGNGAPTFITTT